jgi:hypothetical protein
MARARNIRMLGAVAAAATATAAATAPAAPCYGRLNQTFAFEEVCYVSLFNGTDNLELREYAAGAGAAATLVTYNASSAITVYQEALEETAFYVIEYFIGNANVLNKSLLSSRTVPLALRPPSKTNPSWLGFMALAPSRWPQGKTPPKPTYGVELTPLGGHGGKAAVLLAVKRASARDTPQPSDFDLLCSQLYAAVGAQLPGYAVDFSSVYTPTHARYYGFEFIGDSYSYECWLGVKKT